MEEIKTKLAYSTLAFIILLIMQVLFFVSSDDPEHSEPMLYNGIAWFFSFLFKIYYHIKLAKYHEEDKYD